jgi:hypothetical protein
MTPGPEDRSRWYRGPKTLRIGEGGTVYEFEAIQFIEHIGKADLDETHLGTFWDEADAVRVTRTALRKYLAEGNTEYAWWVVRVKGARLANFIVDSRSEREFMVDLRTGELLEIE